MVLDSVIGEEQSAFIAGRGMHDNIMLASNLVKHYGRAAISPRVVIKVDIRKAFDSLNWNFIKDVMLGLNFPRPFVEWIYTCISTLTYTIAVNGGHYGYFKGSKGLRQGDPLSPYLFVLAMEILSRRLRRCRATMPFHYHPKCAKINLTHLIFADDLLLFSKGDKESVITLYNCLNSFASISGLAPSPAKTNIYFGGVGMTLRQHIMGATGFSEGLLPFKYLGVPLSGSRLRVAHYAKLIDKIDAKIHHWTSLTLSHAGKLQLMNSVLASVLVYWCSVFLLPKAVVKLINTHCRDFYWGDNDGIHKIHWLKWETFARPRKEGGVGIKEILSWNKAFFTRWIWKIYRNSKSIWTSWASAYLMRGDTIWTARAKGTDSWIWGDVLHIRDEIVNNSGSIDAAVSLLQSWEVAGRFHVKKAYNFFRTPAPVILKLQYIWNALALPKHQVVGWMIYHRRLATLDNIQLKGFHLANCCVLCKTDAESHQHLFFNCSYMRKIWSEILLWIGVTRSPKSFTRELEFLHKERLNGALKKVYCCALMATAYHGWIERNNRIFRDINCDWKAICSKIKFEVACRVHSCFLSSDIVNMDCMSR